MKYLWMFLLTAYTAPGAGNAMTCPPEADSLEREKGTQTLDRLAV